MTSVAFTFIGQNSKYCNLIGKSTLVSYHSGDVGHRLAETDLKCRPHLSGQDKVKEEEEELVLRRFQVLAYITTGMLPSIRWTVNPASRITLTQPGLGRKVNLTDTIHTQRCLTAVDGRELGHTTRWPTMINWKSITTPSNGKIYNAILKTNFVFNIVPIFFLLRSMKINRSCLTKYF